MLRKSRGRVERASSAIVPASSTPVGPAPMMTKVSSAAWRCTSGDVSPEQQLFDLAVGVFADDPGEYVGNTTVRVDAFDPAGFDQ